MTVTTSSVGGCAQPVCSSSSVLEQQYNFLNMKLEPQEPSTSSSSSHGLLPGASELLSKNSNIFLPNGGTNLFGHHNGGVAPSLAHQLKLDISNQLSGMNGIAFSGATSQPGVSTVDLANSLITQVR